MQILLTTAFILTVSIMELPAQACLSEGIVFRSQSQLDSFEVHLPTCREISGFVIVEEDVTGNISSLQGLAQVTIIGQYLEIRNNTELKDLTGLESLTGIDGRLTITGNKNLKSTEALKSLNFVGESLRISDNPSLTGINSFEGLQVIRGDLSISNNRNLIHFKGFENIIEIDRSLVITGNTILNSLDNLNKLRIIRGNLFVQENSFLRDLSGLESLSQIMGDFIIDHNQSLVSLSGLASLSVIQGYFHIVNNRSLIDLTGVKSLKSISGLLQIYNNDALESLNGLDSISDQNIRDLAIISCPQLKGCGVESICNYLKNPLNTYSISKNKDGCNNRSQILSDCDRGGGDSNPGPNIFVFFPNPTPGIVKFKGGIGAAILSVSDVAGKLIFRKPLEGDLIDLTDLASGMYLIELHSEKKTVLAPVIKI